MREERSGVFWWHVGGGVLQVSRPVVMFEVCRRTVVLGTCRRVELVVSMCAGVWCASRCSSFRGTWFLGTMWHALLLVAISSS